MAKKTADTTPLDNARISTIAGELSVAFGVLGDQLTTEVETRDAAKAAIKAGVSPRELVLTNVAALSLAGGWSPREIDAASKKAVAMHNNALTEKGLENFVGDAKAAAHPHVRHLFDTLIEFRTKLWDKEEADLKSNPDHPAPLKVAFARKYSMLKRMMTAVRDDGVSFATDADVIRFAEANNPEQDAGKILKRLATMAGDLRDMGVEFPYGEVTRAAKILEDITKEHLAKSRADKLAAQKTLPPTVGAPPVQPETVPPATPAAQPDVRKLANAFTPKVPIVIDPVGEALGDAYDNLIEPHMTTPRTLAPQLHAMIAMRTRI